MLNIIMSKRPPFNRITCDVYCEWQGEPPRYRAYINDELFAERTWIWPGKDFYLEESFQIEAGPGKYKIRYELLQPYPAKFWVENFRVDYGLTKVTQSGEFEIS